MDANHLRFWALLKKEDWLPPHSAPQELAYNDAHERLKLASVSRLKVPDDIHEVQVRAQQLLDETPMTTDAFGSRAYWDGAHVMATGAVPGEIPICTPPAGQQVTDLCLGYDGILYIALKSATAGQPATLMLVDRRGRWDSQSLVQTGTAFDFHRVAAHVDGGVWAINTQGTTLARVVGEPLANRPIIPMQPNAFDYSEPNPNPPRITASYSLPNGEQGVAVAADSTGRPLVVSWRSKNTACVRRLNDAGSLTAPQVPGGLQFPYSVTFLDDETIALLATGATQALVFTIGDVAAAENQSNGTALPVSGDPYPLPDFVDGPFLHGLTKPPEFPTSSGSSELYPLSLHSFASSGWTPPWPTNPNLALQWHPKIFDSGIHGATWHRIYLEASIPPGCAVRVLVAASDAAIGRPDSQVVWYEHRFGPQYSGWEKASEIPIGAWVYQSSEIPFHPGLLGCRAKGSKGLFTALVQRGGCSVELPEHTSDDPSSICAGTRVRALRGRYARVRVQLIGDGGHTPEIAALRIYASRFSYVEHYLPELYQEQLFSPDADASGESTRQDFLERFLDNFEGVLTVMEDYAADSYLLTRAQTTPDDSLGWLASWIGLAFDPMWPKDRRRGLLAATPELYRRHGTLRGLQLALDTATGGLQSEGAVLVVENYRFRHTFATILGADLEQQDNPLLPGLMHSGNSFVGDTLFLGKEQDKEFLALFLPGAAQTPQEAAAAQRLYDELANRVTVLVHQDIDPQQLGLVQRVVEIERPAHVLPRIVQASTALLIGMASLLGVDTFLRNKPPLQPIRVEQSQVGRFDVVTELPSLDPRLQSAVGNVEFDEPIAKLKAPPSAVAGFPLTLDASDSRASGDNVITKYSWTVQVIGS
jgi:phage tail-like protein